MSEPIETIPASPPPPDESPFNEALRVWQAILTSPKEETYAQLAVGGQAKTAYLWIFLASAVSMFITFLFGGMQSSDMLETVGVSMIALLCMAPFMGAFVTLFAALGTALVQWFAKLMGGEGNFDSLMYLYGGIAAPVSLISSVLNIIPFVGGIFGSLLSFYSIYMQVVAVKAVNRFSWGKAVAAALLPALLIFLLVGCCIALVLLLIGPSMGEVFSQIQTMP